MTEPFIGEIRLFAGNFPPRGWAYCNGQLLPIVQYTALFSILGIQYGGNGMTSFALPDMQGSVPVHQGSGPGLSNRTVGETGGAGTVTLQISEMASHQHIPQAQSASSQANPDGAVWSKTKGRLGPDAYTNSAPNKQMSGNSLSVVGSSQAHNNMQPYLGLSFIIALDGIIPSRS